MKIPILGIPDKPIISTSQNHLVVADITSDVVLLKGGGAAIVLESTALNFSLLSEREQEAVVAAYSAFMNSLSFPIQILIRSQKKDISTYLAYLGKVSKEIKNPKLSSLMNSYQTFIKETVKKKNILGKRFYIIIPFSPLELGVTPKSFLTLFSNKGPVPFPKSYVIKKSKIALYPKRDHLIRQAGRLGLKLKQLTNSELVGLFRDHYSPPASTITRPQLLKEEGQNEPEPVKN